MVGHCRGVSWVCTIPTLVCMLRHCSRTLYTFENLEKSGMGIGGICANRHVARSGAVCCSAR